MSQPAAPLPRDAAAGPARLHPAPEKGRGHRKRRPRRDRRFWPPRWVIAAGVVLGSIIVAISPLPLSGFVAWVVAWALIAVAVTGFVEFGRRRWFPRIAAAVRRRGDEVEVPDRLRRLDGRDGDWYDDDPAGDYEDWPDDARYAAARTARAGDTRPWQAARPRPAAASGPAGRRSTARQRAALAARQIAVPKTGVAPPAEAGPLADKIREFRSDDGDDLQAWCDELAALFYLLGEALSDAHDGMVNDTGLDEIPAAAVHTLADQVVELGAGALEAKETILKYYEDPITFAESGGRMTRDGRFWEQH
jgi:hypothetical protein